MLETRSEKYLNTGLKVDVIGLEGSDLVVGGPNFVDEVLGANLAILATVKWSS